MSFIGDFENESKRQTNRGHCLHRSSGTCCNQIISAHSSSEHGAVEPVVGGLDLTALAPLRSVSSCAKCGGDDRNGRYCRHRHCRASQLRCNRPNACSTRR